MPADKGCPVPRLSSNSNSSHQERHLKALNAINLEKRGGNWKGFRTFLLLVQLAQLVDIMFLSLAGGDYIKSESGKQKHFYYYF